MVAGGARGWVAAPRPRARGAGRLPGGGHPAAGHPGPAGRRASTCAWPAGTAGTRQPDKPAWPGESAADVGALCWNACQMDNQPGGYRLLRRPAPPPGPPRLDAAQQAVVSHPGGPLLVLAGPGTGKTTAIVEAVVERITQRQIDPERVLVLTFSRKAAQELRERITTRLRRTTRQPLALTFHSYAYALVRREFVLAGDEPPTLLSGPEQLLEVRRMLRAEAGVDPGGRPPALLPGGLPPEPPAPARRVPGDGRSSSGPRWPPAGSPPNCATSCSARPSAGWTAAAWPGWAARRPRRLGRGGRLPRPVHRPVRPRAGARVRLRRDRPDRRGAAQPGGDPGPGAQGLRRRAGGRVPGHRPGPGGAAARAGRGRPGADRGR